ncbi:MAG: V-type ATP synthase subunit B [Clostridiales bacterium]|jgi:V/A-type H+-transporting ATPase subunit B|nr:V-type ATP synthase subunit B [Clostridiales bacterium]
MSFLEFLGFEKVNSSFLILENLNSSASFGEMVEIKIKDKKKLGKVVEICRDKIIVQVFGSNENISVNNTVVKFLEKQMEIKLSEEILGRIFDGVGNPIDGLGEIYYETKININNSAINPVSRLYPRNYIQTGISSIDSLITLIRGQKLPIFSCDGLPHNQLAAQIIRQASLGNFCEEKFCIVFAAMGIKYDIAEYFKKSFEESGVLEKVVMFLNLADDPVAERLITPRLALTTAEYLAYEKNINVLVIMTDITSYAEALREISSAREEVPSRKGYPGYLYSELASLFERAGIVKKSGGSVTQIPILTMPNDDITHPIPDLTGYITEGQIVLDRLLYQKNIYPPINILPSLSRLMKDGIGEKYTREDHQDLANQLFSCYVKVQDTRALSSVIGEDELNEIDKNYIFFGKVFEKYYLNQDKFETRNVLDTLELGWKILGLLPKSELDRIKIELLDKYYSVTDFKYFMI